MFEKAINRPRNADADLKDVMRGSAIAFGVKLLAEGSAFPMNVVIARQLGADEAGLFFLAYTIIVVAAAITRLGLDNTFVRFIATYHAKNQWGSINGIHRTGMRWGSLVASLAMAGLLLLLAEPLAAVVFNKPSFADVMRVMAFGIPLIALFTLNANALQGIKQIPQSMIVLSVAAPFGLAGQVSENLTRIGMRGYINALVPGAPPPDPAIHKRVYCSSKHAKFRRSGILQSHIRSTSTPQP